MTTHRRIVATKPGGPDVLQMIEEPLPVPGAGEVRVRIEASGVSWGDIMMRRGIFYGGPLRFPFTPGYDFVGHIEAVGPGVDAANIGRRIACLTIQRGYAETTCVPLGMTVPLQDGIDAVTAVAVVLNYATALQMLSRAVALKQGQKILVFGAAGGVGTALLDLGRLKGLRLVGVAAASKHVAVRSFGAAAFDSKSPTIMAELRQSHPEGFDAVFDPSAGGHVWSSYRLVSRRGTLVAFGIADALRNGKRNTAAVMGLMGLLGLSRLDPRKRAKLYAIDQVMKADLASIHQDLTTLFEMLQRGEIKPAIHQSMPLQDAGRAHQIVESFAGTGKIVLVP